MSAERRWWRSWWLKGPALGLSGLLVLVVAAGAWVLSPWGNGVLRDVVVAQADRALAGRVEIAALELDLDRLALAGVKLRDPEGDEVAAVDRLEVAFSLWALLRNTIHVERVRLHRPRLDLVSDAAGSNLARALAPTAPPEPEAPASPSAEPWTFVLGDLRIDGGELRMRDAAGGPGAPPTLTVSGLAVEGRAQARTTPAPGGRPPALEMEGDLALRSTLTSFGSVPVQLHARTEVRFPRAHLELAAKSPGGNLSLTAAADLATPALESLQARGDGIDLARLHPAGPPSDLGFRLSASAAGARLPDDLVGRIELDVPAGRVSGARVGPVALAARIDRGRVALDRLVVNAPALELRAEGHLARQSLALSGKLAAGDLARTARALLGEAAAAELGLFGEGTLSFDIGGTPEAPAVDVRGGFRRLGTGDNRLTDLTLRLRSPDIFRPIQSHADVSVGRLHTPTLAARAVKLRFSAPGARAFRLELGAAGDLAGHIAARGRWIVPGQSFFLDGLDLRARGVSLALARPSRFHLRDGPLRIEGLELAGSGQRLALDLRLGPGEDVLARAKVDLDLGLLPRALLPPDLALRGRLSLELDSAGKLPLPPSTVRVRLERGRLYGLEDVALTLDASLRRRRMAGTFELAALGSGAAARFDLPATWPWPAGAPVSLALSTRSVDLGEIRRLLADAAATWPAVSGRLDAAVTLEGRAPRPAVKVRAGLADLVIDGQKLGGVALELADPGQGKRGLGVRFAAPDLGGGARIALETPYRPFELFTRPAALAPARLLANPVVVKADLVRLPLATLGRLAGRDGLSGHASVKLDLAGPPRAILGTAAVELAAATAPTLPPTDLALALALDPDAVAVEGTVTQLPAGGGGKAGPRRLLTLAARAAIPANGRFDPGRWLNARLRVDAQLGPVRIERKDAALSPTAPLTAQLEGAIRVRGTARAPELEVGATVRELALGDKRLGQARLHASYLANKPEVDVTIEGRAGGTLTLHAATLEPVPVPRWLDPRFSPAKLPLVFELSSKKLELEVFSGLLPSLRELGGQLDGQVSWKGSLDAPRFQGRLALAGGKATVSEVGRFEDIAFDVAATETGLELHRLAIARGEGRARVSGKADRTKGQGLALALEADVDRFPVSSAGTRLGTATLRLRAKGRVDGAGVRITPLAIDQARIELEGTTPKEVQALERPEDIVYVRGGRPLDAGEAERLKQRRQALGLEPADPDPEGKPGRRRRSSFPIRVEIQAPRNLWVRGADANVELGLSDDFRVTVEEQTEVFGVVDVKRGTVKVFGRRFDVARDSTVRFEGPPARPRLDTRIDHFNEREDVKVWITAKGALGELDIAFNSDPSYGQSEILTLLLTGRLDLSKQTGVDTRNQAASLVGGYLASELQKSVLANVPLDVLTIGPEAIEAGTYLTDDLYLGYVRNLEATSDPNENINAVHLEYEISPRWSLEGEYGDAHKGSADLIWKIDY